MNPKHTFFLLLTVSGICLILETFCWFILKNEGLSVGFLFHFDLTNEVTATKGFGFNEIDPLCGWAMSNQHLESMGYETENNCVVLRSKGTYPITPLKLFITGGSTSDIALHEENWPIYLHQLLAKDSINAIVYAGGVGGYTSGQELLKLLRDGINIKPDIHISYAGANEGADKGYVSEYEEDFYVRSYRESLTSKVLPSTIFAIKKALQIGYVDLTIKKTSPIKPYDFWRQNMKYMNAMAKANGSQFIGVLQPVLAITQNNQQSEHDIDPGGYGKFYKTYYPQAQKHIKDNPDNLYDLTTIFDTIPTAVYIDDCHIQAAYQPLVAQAIFTIVKSRLYNSTSRIYTSEN